jgi:GDP-mannose 6-dehydrogenase
VSELANGRSPITEPGLAELLLKQVASGRLSATQDVNEAIRHSDLALICVGTPSAFDGRVSLLALERVMADIGRALRKRPGRYTVVSRSTLLPGMLEERMAPLLERASGRILGEDLFLCNNPEFLRETTAIQDYDNPPYVVVGAENEEDAEPVLELFEQISAEKVVTDRATAALLKYACNAFHAMKITFANEMGVLARSFGADGLAVMDLLCRDRKLNISKAYLRPGFAFGGSCLPKDVRALTRHAEMHGVQVDLLKGVLPSNKAHLDRGFHLVQEANERRVGLVGLSFKAGTDDLRESPFVILAEALLGHGYKVRIYDPYIQVGRLKGRNLTYIDRHLPHLAALLVESAEELIELTDMLVFGNDLSNEPIFQEYAGKVVDLRRDLALPSSSSTSEDEFVLLEPSLSA